MIFITGANGFVGQELNRFLKKSNYKVTLGSRSIYGDLSKFSDWEKILKDHSVVVHLAARVHVMKEQSQDPLTEFREINVKGTLTLAREAKKAGVKKFIFISSIKVNGEKTLEKPFSADDVPFPSDPYGISKMEAERELIKLHDSGVFDVIIIRPPLVYGKEVKANFKNLFKLIKINVPLPFGSVNNKRSFVSVLNLCDLITICIEHPNAGGEIFLVSDKADYSLKEMIENMGQVLNKKPILFQVPVSLMKIMLTLIGKKNYSDRLFNNLQLDIEKTKRYLHWSPKYSFRETFE